MPEPRIYNVKLAYKLPFEERTRYRENEDRIARWIEHMSEEVPVGEPVEWAVETTPEVAEEFSRAENLEWIEEAPTDHAFGRLYHGTDYDALKLNGLLKLSAGRLSPLLMVADTGATRRPYVWSRLREKWTWFEDDAMDRQGHGSHCLGAATPPVNGKFVVSAKVLGDNGSGSSAYTVAALYRFARLCRDERRPGVASLSLGSNYPSQAYQDAIRFAESVNVAVVAAAGNDGRRDGISYPAHYCISVGAHDRSYGAASFSNRSADHDLPDCYALGVDVLGLSPNERNVKMSGTSMATPLAARALLYAASGGIRAGSFRSLARNHNGAARILSGKRIQEGYFK
jgi:subtilisin family serine protease